MLGAVPVGFVGGGFALGAFSALPSFLSALTGLRES
jgi:hypothetical protein